MPIPTDPSPTTFNSYVRNIVKAYRKAATRFTDVTPAQLQAIVWTVWVCETQYQRA